MTTARGTKRSWNLDVAPAQKLTPGLLISRNALDECDLVDDELFLWCILGGMAAIAGYFAILVIATARL